MKKSYLFLLIALIGISMASCSGSTESTDATTDATESCTYSLDNSTTKVGFTAYKFIRKAGVGGGFDNIAIKNSSANENPLKVIEGVEFEIPINGLNTNDVGRDVNITTYFFNVINTENITGKVVKLEDGKATLEISMNGITNTVEGGYTLEGEVFNFTADIDVNNWNAQAGIEALNKECYDLHLDHENGDTESKLWPDVAISFSTTLAKSCE